MRNFLARRVLAWEPPWRFVRSRGRGRDTHGAYGAQGAFRGHWLRLAALTAIVLLCLAARVEALDAPAPGRGLLSPAELPAMAALDLAALRAAYPGAILGMSRRPSGGLDLVLAHGERLTYDDGRARTPEQALEEPDVRAMLAQAYPLGAPTRKTANPRPGFDPGRSRVEPLLKALYGADEDAVRAVCRPVVLDGRRVLMNRRFGAAEALGRVWRRLAPCAARPAWRQVLSPLGGGFCWREIAATDRLSAHSFGIAVDLNPALPYWLTCRRPEAAPARVLAFPRGVVAAFEAEGFIWGGKWAAFDLMHFEYRPELVLKARHLRGDIRLPGAPFGRELGAG